MTTWTLDVEPALLDAALGFADEAARQHFLDTPCANDPGLKARLTGLLAGHADAATFFNFERGTRFFAVGLIRSSISIP